MQKLLRTRLSLAIILGLAFLRAGMGVAFPERQVQTSLMMLQEPTLPNVHTAISKLQKALSLPHPEAESDFAALLYQVRMLLGKDWRPRTFAAAIRCGDEYAFAERSEDAECRRQFVSGVCFLGTPAEALRMVQTALTQNYWSWDDAWVEQATSIGDHLQVRLVLAGGLGWEYVRIPPCGMDNSQEYDET